MLKQTGRLALAAAVGLGLAAGAGAAKAQTPKSGGVLNFVVGSNIPSFDGHQETTFGMIHPIRPFYSLLIRVNPDNPQSTSDFQCDVCENWKVSDGGKTYTFKLREGVAFHDGTPFNACKGGNYKGFFHVPRALLYALLTALLSNAALSKGLDQLHDNHQTIYMQRGIKELDNIVLSHIQSQAVQKAYS